MTMHEYITKEYPGTKWGTLLTAVQSKVISNDPELGKFMDVMVRRLPDEYRKKGYEIALGMLAYYEILLKRREA